MRRFRPFSWAGPLPWWGASQSDKIPRSRLSETKMEKKSMKNKGKAKDGKVEGVAAKDRSSELDESGVNKFKRKEYEKKLMKLHVELVRLQEWVRHEGRKVCIIFEG